MNRRDMLGLGAFTFLGGPHKEQAEPLNTYQSPLYLLMLVRALAQTVRFQMPPAQWAVFSTEKAAYEPFAAGTANALPIFIDADVPKDEIRVVAADGTVMARITNLAIPTGF